MSAPASPRAPTHPRPGTGPVVRRASPIGSVCQLRAMHNRCGSHTPSNCPASRGFSGTHPAPGPSPVGSGGHRGTPVAGGALRARVKCTPAAPLALRSVPSCWRRDRWWPRSSATTRLPRRPREASRRISRWSWPRRWSGRVCGRCAAPLRGGGRAELLVTTDAPGPPTVAVLPAGHGATDALRARARRLAEHSEVAAVVIASPRARHRALEGQMCGVPVRVALLPALA